MEKNSWRCGICGRQGETGAENTLLQCPGCRAVLRRGSDGDSWVVLTRSPEDARKLYRASKTLKSASVVLIFMFLMIELAITGLPAPLFALVSVFFAGCSLFAVLVDLGRREWCRTAIMALALLFALAGLGNVVNSGCFAVSAWRRGGGLLDLFVHLGIFAVFMIIFFTAGNRALFGKNAPTHAQLKRLAEPAPDAPPCGGDVSASRGARRRGPLSLTAIVFCVQLAMIAVVLGVKLVRPGGEELFNRGGLYLTGGGLFKRDEGRAFAYFLRGAKAGHGGCQAMVAALYLQGRGVTRDLKEGHKFAMLAARQEIGLAYDLLARYYAGEFGREVFDPVRCRYWSQKEYDAGMPLGGLHLATCLIEGRGGDRDLKKGIELATVAAEKKIPDAYVLLALYYGGRYDESVADPQKAYFWSEKALQAKHTSGKSCMGICRYRGLGCAADRARGMAMLREAAAAGDPVAIDALDWIASASH